MKREVTGRILSSGTHRDNFLNNQRQQVSQFLNQPGFKGGQKAIQLFVMDRQVQSNQIVDTSIHSAIKRLSDGGIIAPQDGVVLADAYTQALRGRRGELSADGIDQFNRVILPRAREIIAREISQSPRGITSSPIREQSERIVRFDSPRRFDLRNGRALEVVGTLDQRTEHVGQGLKLAEAIETENYELAAKLRDRIEKCNETD